MLPLLVCLSKKFPFSSVIASRRAAPFPSHWEERSAVAIRIPITRCDPATRYRADVGSGPYGTLCHPSVGIDAHIDPLSGATLLPGIGRVKTLPYIPLRRGRLPRRPLPHHRHLHRATDSSTPGSALRSE